MPLFAPNLDDRTAQQLVNEAKRLIPHFCPEWTDHNVSDPGVALIELFAWMTEMLLYRVNQVPEKNYIKFLEMLGIKLEPPQAAVADVTFYLTAPLQEVKRKAPDVSFALKADWEIATARTETDPAVIFTLKENFTLQDPKCIAAASYVSLPAGRGWTERIIGKGIPMFSGTPIHQSSQAEGDSFALIFANDLSNHVITVPLQFTTREGDISSEGINLTNPPRVWEAHMERGWTACELERDGTSGLIQDGEVVLRLPKLKRLDMAVFPAAAQAGAARITLRGYWVRCRLTEAAGGKTGKYDGSPIINLEVEKIDTLGATVTAQHAVTVKEEMLGQSDGTPGQVFRFAHSPLLGRSADRDYLKVEQGEKDNQIIWEDWREVMDFGDSDKNDPHYMIDALAGTLTLGPALLQPVGKLYHFGKTPPHGMRLQFQRYQYGGGLAGNVKERALCVLKQSPAYIRGVINYQPAVGGREAETLETAVLKIASRLRFGAHAVTAADYEYHASQVKGVAAARCLAPGRAPWGEADGGAVKPGTVRLHILPDVRAIEHPRPQDLVLTDELEKAVREALEPRRVLGISIDVQPIEAVEVVIEVIFTVKKGANRQEAEEDVEKLLKSYVHPFQGGPQGKGWPLGQALHRSDLYALLLQFPLLERVESLKIFRQGDSTDIDVKLTPARHHVLCSGKHIVEARNG